MFIYIYVCVCLCVCVSSQITYVPQVLTLHVLGMLHALCVCVCSFWFSFCVCCCVSVCMLRHGHACGFEPLWLPCFFLPHMYPYPNYSFTTPGSSCFFSNLCMYMVFAMNEPLQAGSLCRLGAFAGCHNLLSKLFLKSTMWALFRPGFCASLKQD